MDLRENDAGVLISITVNEDISDATLVQMFFTNRLGQTKMVAATLNAPSNVEYVTSAGIFDRIGKWSGQVRVVQPTRDRRTSLFEIEVEKAL